MIKAIALLAFCAGCLTILPTETVFAGGAPSLPTPLVTENIIATAKSTARKVGPKELIAQSVFAVMPYDWEHPRTGGTGFLIETKSNGKVLITNRHVCEVADNYHPGVFYIEQGSRLYVAKQRAKSNKTDLCIVCIPSELAKQKEALKLASPSEELQPRDHVRVFGHPYLRPLTETEGHFVNTSEEPLGLKDGQFNSDVTFLMGRLDFMVYPGNSGSPILNDDGHVVGVVFAMEGYTQNGLFVPVSELRDFLETEQ